MAEGTCSVEGCETNVRCKGFCVKHYQRWRRNGDPLGGRGWNPDVCTIDGCERPPLARGWCNTHYRRWQRVGDPLADQPHRSEIPKPVKIPFVFREVCEVEGCTNKHNAQGFCGPHYMRWRKYGDPLESRPVPTGPEHHNWAEVPTYGGMHLRVRRAKGRARDHGCQHCDRQAAHWAYDHEDPRSLHDASLGLRYSLDVEHYIPLCVSCHRIFDCREPYAGCA